MSRTDDCRRLAEVMGWGASDDCSGLWVPRTAPESTGSYRVWVPAPDAPLHEHLEFVGRIAEALGVRIGRVSEDLAWEEWRVAFRVEIGHSEDGAEYEDHEGTAPDLSWAAVRAALEAKGET